MEYPNIKVEDVPYLLACLTWHTLAHSCLSWMMNCWRRNAVTLRPEVHHIFLKHKKTDSLYALNYSCVLSKNVPFIFPLGDNTSFLFLYMWNACSYITVFQQKKSLQPQTNKTNKNSPQKPQENPQKTTDTHTDMRK